ncbi:sensor histidine kinase [Actinosynnema pretiosum]|nr:histidine kinase [Actinosynnema pretiosum]
MMRRWLRWRDAAHYLGVGALRGFGSLWLFAALVLVGASAAVGVGWLLAPRARAALRGWAGRERARIEARTGRAVPEGPLPRTACWLALDGTAGLITSAFGAALPLAALNSLLAPAYWWVAPADDPVAAPWPVTSWGWAATMPLAAALYLGLAWVLLPRLADRHARVARWLLAPGRRVALSRRVAELTASRAEALEAHGAELRRIERDLHDSTQNRLVAVVMHLGIAERALRRDAESALPLVLRARDAAGDALSGLRGVVRQIYPPVLAERGLDGAVAGLVADCGVPCTLTTEGVGRAPAAVESAAYFVIAEALTNIGKHSGAERASVRMARADKLVIEIGDDGRGGAAEGGGSGLAGIRRRVGAFDGTTTVSSPVGGPTLVRVELPCAS